VNTDGSLVSWLTRRGTRVRIDRAQYLRGSRARDAVEGPYLDRFFLFRVPGVCGVFLHRFWSSDADDPHDHPWDNFSLVLRGRLREWHHDGTSHMLRPGSMRVRRARELHRLELVGAPGTVWTLFVHGPRYREWGFLRPSGWWRVPYRSTERGLRGWLLPVRRRSATRL
jgi:hypothetical protein